VSTRLILVRHGETDWNLTGRFQGQADVPLNSTGLRQATVLAQRLARERPAAIYASDLARAWQTAQAIYQALASALVTESSTPYIPCAALPLIVEARLRELNYGAWQGLTYTEIAQRYPLEWERWIENPAKQAPPGGESLLQITSRVIATYQEICAAHPEETVILVAHGGSLQILTVYALGLPPERYWQIHLDIASYSELNVYPEGAILNKANDTAHLERWS
jgi:alpha-ribazole phosphatase